MYEDVHRRELQNLKLIQSEIEARNKVARFLEQLPQVGFPGTNNDISDHDLDGDEKCLMFV